MLNIYNWAPCFDKILCQLSHLNKVQIEHMGLKISLMYFGFSVKETVPYRFLLCYVLCIGET